MSDLKLLAVPVLCRGNVMQTRKRGARRAGACLEHVSARPAMPAMPHDRSGATLGKSKISGFEILDTGSEFGPPSPFLEIQSSPMSGTSRFSHNSTRIIAFRILDKRETCPEDTGWARGPLPMVPAATTITASLKSSKIIKNHEKSSKITKNHLKCPKNGFEVVSRQQNPVLAGLMARAATNDY